MLSVSFYELCKNFRSYSNKEVICLVSTQRLQGVERAEGLMIFGCKRPGRHLLVTEIITQRFDVDTRYLIDMLYGFPLFPSLLYLPHRGLNILYFISHKNGLSRAKILCHNPLPHNGYTCIEIIILPYAFKMRRDYLSTSYLDQKYLPSERSDTREI